MAERGTRSIDNVVLEKMAALLTGLKRRSICFPLSNELIGKRDSNETEQIDSDYLFER
jgi:hypothetical protein